MAEKERMAYLALVRVLNMSEGRAPKVSKREQARIAKQARKHKKKRWRKPWPAGVREYVLMRDKCMCSQCGAINALHVHHIMARCNGGTDDSDNLITLCCRCHALAHVDDPVYSLMRKE